VSEETAWYLLLALLMALVAASSLFRGQAVSGGVFIDRETRPGCFWLLTGMFALAALAFVVRAILS
jgi:hypothetical protein